MAAEDDKLDHKMHRAPALDNVDREDFIAVKRARDEYNRERFASFNCLLRPKNGGGTVGN